MPTSGVNFGRPVAVVGSGPGGIAAARALIRKGAQVVLLDAGQQLDEGRRELAARMAGQDHRRWSPEDVRRLTENETAHQRVPKKLVFGSDFLFAGSHPACPVVSTESVTAQPTLARGGYSIAWGGAMMPISDDDMGDWPFRRTALEPAYRRVLAEIPISAVHDELESHFPLFAEPKGSLHLPEQCRGLLADVVRACQNAPADETLLCGQARIAIHCGEGRQACRYCGLCLSGCVYQSIHTFDQDLEALSATGRLDYRPGFMVTRMRESDDGVTLSRRPLDGGEERDEVFSRVFLAAGAINSTRILMESEGHYETPVSFLDSQKFILPLLRLRRDRLEWPDINALPSLFFEARLPSVTPHWVHMQVSPVNDFVLHRLRLQARRGLKWHLMAPAVERLMIAWCGLHSSLSGGFSATLSQPVGDKAGVMHLEARPNAETQPTIKRFVRRIMVKGLGFRTLFLPLPTVGQTGGGNYFGGSFPMTAKPIRFGQSDLAGRPTGWTRVHLVDGSVLPSIPATTVALLIMANADRIVNDVALD